MRKVVRIRRWERANRGTKKEVRIYVDFDDGGVSGCYYTTGNHFQEKGTKENLSPEEWAEVKRLGLQGPEGHRKVMNWEAPKGVEYRHSEMARLRKEKKEDEWARQTERVRQAQMD